MPTVVGLAVFLGLLWWLARMHSWWWRIVGARYASEATRPLIARKFPETVIITARPEAKPARSKFGYRLYGVCRIAIHDGGMSISQPAPFNVLCPPLLLPFDQMELRATDWGLSQVYSLRMRQTPGTDIIVFPRVVRWIREHVDRAPFGTGA